MKFKVRYADQIVGILTIIAIAAVILLLFAMGTKQKWFSRKINFITEFQTAANITEGMTISYKGFSIGKIHSVTLTPKNTVAAHFFIYNNFYDQVKTGAILDLLVSPIGLGSQLLFYPGNGTQLILEGSFIPLRNSTEGKLLIAEKKVTIPPGEDTITQIIRTASSLIQNLNTTADNINQALAGNSDEPLARIIKSLAATAENTVSVSKNIETLSSSIADPTGLIPRLVESDSSIGHLFHDNNVLYDNLISTFASATHILNNITGITGNIDKLTASFGSATPQIASIFTEVQTALVQLQDVLEGLRNNPLLKGGIPERPGAQGITPQLRGSDF